MTMPSRQSDSQADGVVPVSGTERGHDTRPDSTSLLILREHGPMTLRDLTRATARRMGWSLKYADVDGVMRRHRSAGEAQCTPSDDYRDAVWSVS